MDRLSYSYFSMTTGLRSQLWDPLSTTHLVDEMHDKMEKRAPLKNFLFDTSTPHGDVVLRESSAKKCRIGWVTLQATEGIRRGIHEWCIKIENQGDSSDGSGLMLGIVPSNYSKYDSFISQGDGWCLSRAGKFYGHWRPLEPRNKNNDFSFGTGDRVILVLDYEAARLSVQVGDNMVVGEISNLGAEVFPAISLHYVKQHVRFEYHVVHNRSAKLTSWVDRPVLRPPTAFLPLSQAQLSALKLDSYVFSSLFVERASDQKKSAKRGETASSAGASDAPNEFSSAQGITEGGSQEGAKSVEGGHKAEAQPQSLDVAVSRLIVLWNAFLSVQRCVESSASKPAYLSESITAEYLRKRMYESQHQKNGSYESGTGNATFNCGVVLLSQMFVRVASDASSIALPLATSLMEYLQSLPLFSLGESQEQSPFLALGTIQVATDNVVKIVENARKEESATAPLSTLNAMLVELVVVLALQRGLVSESLRAVRLLFQFPDQAVSQQLMKWLQRHSYNIRPQVELPDIYFALRSVTDAPDGLVQTGIDPRTAILSAAYCNGMIFVHTVHGLFKWGRSGASYVQLFHTREPSSYCCDATESTIAATTIRTLLVTDKMALENIAVISYSITLEMQCIYFINDISSWPRTASYTPLLASGPLDQVLAVYAVVSEVPAQEAVAARAATLRVGSGYAASAPPPSAPHLTIECQGFEGTSFPKPVWSTTLQSNSSDQLVLSHCLALRKPSVIDLGSPEESLTVLGGHVTVELYIMLLDKEDSTTLYQHGNQYSSGEVFIETVRLEGACCIRGGYRHEQRGSCVVFAPIPPTAETRFMHIALVFDGAWTLFFDGVEVSTSAPQTSVATPRNKWTVGSNCTCLLAGLRVWRVSRSRTEIGRDYLRLLSDNESGLVCNMLFNEPSGNVVFNYVSRPNAQHGVCSGLFTHVRTAAHPLKSDFSAEVPVPRQHRIHNWRNLKNSSIFTTGRLIGLSQELEADAPYAVRSGRVVMFFDSKSGLAHLSMFIIPSTSNAKGQIGCDHAGKLMELLEMKSKPQGTENHHGPQEDVVSLANLTVEEEKCGLPNGMPKYPLSFRSLQSGSLQREDDGSSSTFRIEPLEASETSILAPSSFLPSSGKASVTFMQLGAWIVQLLSSYAEECTATGELYSFMADDVSRRCVEEVKTLLLQHFRVFKGSNARRAVSLKSPVSTMVISSVLKILLRLIRRARAFSLHPSTLGLNIIDVDGHVHSDGGKDTAWIKRLTTNSYWSSPMNSSNNTNGAGAVDAMDSADTLLALLGDIVNESSTTISSYLGNLARAVLFEGIELFFPNLRCRVNLLREMLFVQSSSAVSFAKPIPSTGTSSSSPPAGHTDKTPAVELLMDAMVNSLASMQSIIPLVSDHFSEDKAERPSSSLEGMDGALLDVQRILVALVEASMSQLHKNSLSRSGAVEGTRRSQEGWGSADIFNIARDENFSVDNTGVPKRCRFLVSLAESISCLQVLLLSSSQQGRGKDSAIVSRTSDLFSFPTGTVSRSYVRTYYETLFRAAQRGLRLTLRCSCEESAMRSPPLDPTSFVSQLELFRNSFMASPLYAAITAIPLVVAFEEAQWFMAQLEALLPLCESLKRECHEMRKPSSSIYADCNQAFVDSLYDTVFFTCAWIATFMAQHTVSGAPAVECSQSACAEFSIPTATAASRPEDLQGGADAAASSEASAAPDLLRPPPQRSAVQDLCDHPLLSGGLLPDAPDEPERVTPRCPRRQFVLELLNGSRLLNLQKKIDPLKGKAPQELVDVVPYMAASALYLCNLPNIHIMNPKLLDDILCDIMKRFFPIRAACMDRNASAKKPCEYRSLAAQEIKKRLKVILSFVSVHSIDPCILHDANTSFQCLDIDTLKQLKDIRHRPGFPVGGKERWRWAVGRVRTRLLWQRAGNVSNELLNVSESVKLITRLVSPQEPGEEDAFGNDALRIECRHRNTLVQIRLNGLDHILQLLRRDPSSADNISFLLTCNTAHLRAHHLYGLNGAPSSALLHVTASFHRLLTVLKKYQLEAKLPASPLREETDVLSRAPSFATVLSRVVNRCWEPRDFEFLCQLSVVDVIFQQSCSIFTFTSGGDVTLSEQGMYERIHRDAAKEHEKHRAAGSKSKASFDENENDKSLVHTPEERSRYSALLCFKHLAIQASSALRKESPVTSARHCGSFLCQLLGAVHKELRHCILHLGQDIQPGAIERISDQVHLLCSLVGVVVCALPSPAQIAGELHKVAAQVSRLLCLFVKFDAFSGAAGNTGLRGAACLRVGTKLLAHTNPAVANKFFEDAEVKSVSAVYFGGVTEENAVITFIFSLIVRSLVATGLSSVAQHAILSMRDLLSSPRWAKELAHLVPAFHDDLAGFATSKSPSDSHAHVSAALKLYVWSTVLGGGLFFLPGYGLPVQCALDDTNAKQQCYVLDHVRDTITVVPSQGQTWDRGEGCRDQKKSGFSETIRDTEFSLSEDKVFMSSFTGQVRLPEYNGLLDEFIAPALDRIVPMLEKSDRAPVDLISIIGFLSIALAMVKKPVLCQALVRRGCLRVIHQIASRLTPRDALPLVHLKEFVAYAISSMMKSLSGGAATGMLSSPDIPRGELKLHPMPRSSSPGARTIMMAAPAALFSWSQARYTLLSLKEEQFGATPSPAFPGLSPMRQPYTSPSPTLLCFPVGKNKMPAYVAVSCGQGSAASSLVVWEDSLSLEVAVLMSDRMFPALGEYFTIPCQWGRPDLSFDLVSLYAAQENGGSCVEDAPLLGVSVRGNELLCCLCLSGIPTVEVTLGLQWEDWDTFLYVAAFLEMDSITLCKGRETVTKRLPTEVTALLNQNAKKNAVALMMLGTPPQPPSTEEPQVPSSDFSETHHVLLSSFRLSNFSKPKLSMGNIADEVSRDQILQFRESDGDTCYFGLSEGSGESIQSSNGQFSGLLHGKVRWVAHSRKGALSVSLDCVEKLSTGTHNNKLSMIPRKEILMLFSSLDALGLDYMTLSLLESLSAHLTRLVVIGAVEQCLSPDYKLFLQPSKGEAVSHLFEFFEYRGITKQFANLLRFSDSGMLSPKYMQLSQRLVFQVVDHLSRKDPESVHFFFEDVADAVRSILHNSTELFPVDIPSQPSQSSPLMPMSFVNGGHGILSFDVKGRFVEHANIFKDRAKKSILAKFPDNKGSCPDFPIPADTQWLYVRSCAFSRHHNGSARLVTLNVMLRSLRPAVISTVFTAACNVLQRKPSGYAKSLPYFLNSSLMTALLPRENLSETEHDSIQAASVLSNILHLWSYFPNVQPFDQSPMHIMLANANASLVNYFHRGFPGPEDSQTICPVLEAFNSYTRLQAGALVAAIRLEECWYGRTYRVAVWQRWCRLLRLWEQSASQVTYPKEAAKAKSTKKRINVIERISARKRLIELEPVDTVNAPPIVIHQRGSGEWFVRSERSVMTVRSSVGFTRGRIYFEVRMPDNNVNLNLAVGVVTEKWLKTCDSTSTIGQDAESWCFDIARLSATYQGCRTDFTSRIKWKMGDVAGILVDLESNRLLCFHNDRQVSTFEKLKVIGSSGSSLPTFFPAVFFGSSGCNVNFGSAPFACRLPAGAVPVDPSHFHTPEATRMWHIMAAKEWSDNLPEPIILQQSQGALSATALSIQHYLGLSHPTTLSHRPTPSRQLQSPVLSVLLRHFNEYSEGRSGAMSVDLLCSNDRAKVSGGEVRVGEVSCLVRGSVIVQRGKWYYEVITRDEAGLSIGWASADHLVDWSRTRSLGDDEHSWSLEGRRMIAKHNNQHINLYRHVWKSGNVVGCLLDCDAGTIAYTINGNVQREAHDSSGDGILFRNVDVGPGGLTPAVSLEPKSEAVFMWNLEDLLYLPSGYKPLGGSCVITQGLTEHYLLSLDPPVSHGPPPSKAAIQRREQEEQSKAMSYSVDTMEKVVRYVSRAVDLSPMNLSPYCLEKSIGIRTFSDAKKSGEEETNHRLRGSLGLSESELRSYLLVLHLLSASVERIHPFCYEGTISVDANGGGCYFSPLYTAFRALKRCCLSFVNLKVVRRLLQFSNGPGQSLKLTLNRRSALVLSRSDVSPITKLRESLFGQVYKLLYNKPNSLFCTNKKLWSVVFFGEGADDVGGPYRECLSQLCTELMGPNLSLFLPSPNQANEMGDSRETYVLAPSVNFPVELRMYQFIGRLMGGCLRSSEPLALYLPSVVWRTLVGEIPDVSDLERVDVATVQSLQYIANLLKEPTKNFMTVLSLEEQKKLDMELADMIPDGFTIADDSGLRHDLLTPCGRQLGVNHANTYLYVLLTVYFKLHVFGMQPLRALKEGFLEVVPLYHISYLKWYELEELVCGQRDYLAEELLENARYEGISKDDLRVQYLREVLKEFSSHQRASFMRFVTGRQRLLPGMTIRIMPDNRQGSAQPPWTGDSRGSSSPIRSNIATLDPNIVEDSVPFDDERLPHASTCFYWLSLPKYSSKEVLREKLLFAIEQCFDIDADFRIRDQDTAQMDTQPVLTRVTVDDEEFEDYSHLL